MKGDHLPLADHVLRHTKGTLITDGNVDGSAFLLRPEEEYLSVSWLEYLSADVETSLEGVRSARRKQWSSTHRLAQLNVGRTVELMAGLTLDGTVLHVPLDPQDNPPFPADPAHSGVFGLPASGNELAEIAGDLLAASVVALQLAVKPLPNADTPKE